MGQLVERSLPTLFGGVSNQPEHVRRPNQFEVQTNALSSVVSGGIEKRPCTQLIAALSTLDTTKEYAVFEVDRDPTEQNMVVLDGEGDVKVFDTLTGSEATVTIGDTKKYFLVEATNVDSTGVMDTSALTVAEADGWDSSDRYRIYHDDTQFDWGWISSDGTLDFDLEGSADGSSWVDLATGKTGASGSFSTTVGAAAANDHNYIRISIDVAAGSATDTLTLWATYKDKTYLATAITGPEDFAFVAVADYYFICNRNVYARLAEINSGTLSGYKQKFSDLPAASGSGNIWKVTGQDTDGFAGYYVIDDTTSSTWEETVNPNDYNTLDASSLPHQLVRNADGTFTFQAASFGTRAVGDSTLQPAPTFVGKQVADVIFFRNRLGFVADENVFLSRSGDALEFFPQKAVDVLDTDPVDRAATTTDVNILQWGAVYRKVLFVTSLRAQFEMTSESSFGPETAQFDMATRYPASAIAKPKPMGDVLYFASDGANNAVMYEYFFDEASFANTATDVTKHIFEYIPNTTLKIVTDATSGTLVLLTTGEQNSVYLYRTFFDGNEKIMSSWSKYTFGASEAEAFIHGIAMFSGFLVLLIERSDGYYLEQMSLEREASNAAMGYIPLIDQREVATGTYDSTNDVTVWTPTWAHNDDAEVVLGPNFTGDDIGRRMTVVYPDEYLLTLASVAAGEVITISDGTTSQDYTAHATTTTTANREFSISGTDTADAGELVTCINDATDGHPTISATDNGDGTITLLPDDEYDTSIVAPTGTAITNATITATEVDQRIAARGQHDDDQAYLGRQYEMEAEFSKQYMQDGESAILNGRLQLRDMRLAYVESGYFKVEVIPRLRDTKTYEFTGRVVGDDNNVVGSAAIDDLGTFRFIVNSNGETCRILVKNDTPFPSVITSASWRGFFNEISRQG